MNKIYEMSLETPGQTYEFMYYDDITLYIETISQTVLQTPVAKHYVTVSDEVQRIRSSSCDQSHYV